MPYCERMTLLRWLIGAFGTVALLGALGFLLFLPESIAEYAREPEDVWLQTAWAVVLVLLSGACFWNAWRMGRTRED